MALRRLSDIEALIEQADRINAWLVGLEADDLLRPSVLPDWSIGRLVGHLAEVVGEVTQSLSQPARGRALALTEHLRRSHVRAQHVTQDGIDPRAALTAATAALADGFGTPGSLPDVVTAGDVRVTSVDLIASRMVELVVHGDDLSRSLPGPPPLEPVKRALAVSCRTLATVLAEQNPGRSIEVRVPPHAAVQCGQPGDPGPTHTRGTPPNVVETDPTTWLRLATGRTGWAEARTAGAVRASGQRADLTALLPVLS